MNLELWRVVAPETLEVIADSMVNRLSWGEGEWQDAPVYYDGIAIQACDCGQRVSLLVHSLEFMDDQCSDGCVGASRTTTEAPSTWLPSGFAMAPT